MAKNVNTTKQTNAPAPSTEAPVMQTAITPTSVSPPALISSAPAWLQEQMGGRAPVGLEKMEQADLVIARLVLAQAMSPEVQDADTNGYGIEVGDIFDNLTKQVRAKAGTPLMIIPIVLGKSRLHFGDINKDEGILCRSEDGITARAGGDGVDEGGQPTRECAKCVLKEFDDTADDSRPACSELYNVVVLLPEFDYTPCVWSSKHTNVKVVKRFLSAARMTKADFFAQKYALTSKKEKSDKHTYMNFDFKQLGWVNEAEYRAGKDFYGSLSDKTWAADTSDMEGGNASQAADETGDAVETPAPAPAVVAPAKATTVDAPVSKKKGDVPF